MPIHFLSGCFGATMMAELSSYSSTYNNMAYKSLKYLQKKICLPLRLEEANFYLLCTQPYQYPKETKF